eukprot:CAMPEP_0197176360 /NCGR_PEP_ID=MMETSP1423-20130617/2319_1 /TAXON_ID=476441 /ORGANISM="Pseudo-nitzschia heimii, Strain UNC1101" /LENGTH=538 /DNA_ID=CAMNT_0042625733 /DNA_START=154 /DNA_END=1767 /DNA_ORIENTATION=+
MRSYQSSKMGTPSGGCPFATRGTVSSSKDDRERSDDTCSTSTRSRGSSDPILNSSIASSCPFAQSLNNTSDNDDSSLSSSTDHSAVSAILASPPSPSSSTSLWKECPVFANNSCPFKDAKSDVEVSQILMKLPASHTEKARPTHAVLIETLANLHRDKAMEGYSFSAVMSELARDHNIESKAEIDDDLSMDSGEFRMPASQNQKNFGHEMQKAAKIPPSDMPHVEHKSLSEALKTGTEEAHKEAESVHFVKNFIRGKIDRNLYALFVAQMFHVYRRLEQELDEHAPQNFPDCHFPKELKRFEALQDDIDFWQGSGDEPPISPATQDYLDRITKVANERPLLLLAHAYTRYLGDLSGGKILARVAKRALHLGSDGNVTEGLAFYDFPLLRGSVKAFKDRYRQALNDLQFEDTDEAVNAIVEEANIAFLLNMRLFEELDVIGSVPGASVRPIDEVYSFDAIAKHSSDENSSAQCPFANMSGATAFQHRHDHEPSNHAVRHEHVQSHSKTCPWPFILLHDPKTGMRQWQTWAVIGLILMYS